MGTLDSFNVDENLIFAKGKPISSDIAEIQYNSLSKKWDITFKNGKLFHYNQNNVSILSNHSAFDFKNKIIWHDGRYLNDISEIYVYSYEKDEFWRIFFQNGHEKIFNRKALQIEDSVLLNDKEGRVFNYLKEIADFISVRTEDGKAILSSQYEKIDSLGADNIGSVFLKSDNSPLRIESDTDALVFPFGCNENQYRAVANALKNKLSIIEGPPGTGKTQTILNIIANLVLQGKTVQVVSNNNSAIDNIFEKLALPEYQMQFIAARLGSTERKNIFIESQSGEYPNISEWKYSIHENEYLTSSLRAKSQRIHEIFNLNEELAKLRDERYTVNLEFEHVKKLVLNNNINIIQISRKLLTSAKILNFWNEYKSILDGAKKAGIFFKLYCRFFLGINVGALLKEKTANVINSLQYAFYSRRIEEIDDEISKITNNLNDNDADTLIKKYTDVSLNCFKDYLYKRYSASKQRPVFQKNALFKNYKSFLAEYPVVLSTTYTARSSLGRQALFDYVIIDEASQTDVATGFLALSSAVNAVIVGDSKQLPNVVTSEQKYKLKEIFNKYGISESYNYENHSLLDSVLCIFKNNAPAITLCEHYRCHPQIIGFCNKKFYDDRLIIMSRETSNSALRLVTTVAGNHSRDKHNQRQIDVICEEILPQIKNISNDIGIIAPYRNQVNALREFIKDDTIEIDTVHKFQGREKDVIIISMVDDYITEFSDNPNLLNVAVSRAKKYLIVVTSGNEYPAGSNLGDLIGYMCYNNCDVQHSEISSVFDYLYHQYTKKRLEYLKKCDRVSEYDSENLMYKLIKDVLARHKEMMLDVVCHQPMQLLFVDQSKMNEDEKRFVNTGLSHVDFLLYNKVSKKPMLAIEVDGFSYHKDGTKQAERDKIKNHIMDVYGLPLLRFSTNGSSESRKLEEALQKLIPYYSDYGAM